MTYLLHRYEVYAYLIPLFRVMNRAFRVVLDIKMKGADGYLKNGGDSRSDALADLIRFILKSIIFLCYLAKQQIKNQKDKCRGDLR